MIIIFIIFIFLFTSFISFVVVSKPANFNFLDFILIKSNVPLLVVAISTQYFIIAFFSLENEFVENLSILNLSNNLSNLCFGLLFLSFSILSYSISNSSEMTSRFCFVLFMFSNLIFYDSVLLPFW